LILKVVTANAGNSRSASFRGFKLSDFGDLSGLAAMAQDGIEKRYGIAVVHETRLQADAPKRAVRDFIGALLYSGTERPLR